MLSEIMVRDKVRWGFNEGLGFNDGNKISKINGF